MRAGLLALLGMSIDPLAKDGGTYAYHVGAVVDGDGVVVAHAPRAVAERGLVGKVLAPDLVEEAVGGVHLAGYLVMVKRVFRHPAGQVILAVILAGAVGNLIDRVLFGYVTDMFQTIFINFAVFNVADCCLVCGVIAMMVYVLFFYDKLEKAPAGQEAGHDAADPEG